jgi:alpha-tubulin suppressor-like RCC1 family protein
MLYAFGARHTLAIAGGEIYASGNNASGQLGDGTLKPSSIPVRIDYFKDILITAVAAGQSHSLALGQNGKVYAWGSNDLGQLGLGLNAAGFHSTPQIVDFGDMTGAAGEALTIVAVAAGANHSLALRSDSLVYAWGANSKFQVHGNGSKPPSTWVQPENVLQPTLIMMNQ